MYVHYPTRPLDPSNMEPTPTQIFGSVSGRFDILPWRNTLFFSEVLDAERWEEQDSLRRWSGTHGEGFQDRHLQQEGDEEPFQSRWPALPCEGYRSRLPALSAEVQRWYREPPASFRVRKDAKITKTDLQRQFSARFHVLRSWFFQPSSHGAAVRVFPQKSEDKRSDSGCICLS